MIQKSLLNVEMTNKSYVVISTLSKFGETQGSDGLIRPLFRINHGWDNGMAKREPKRLVHDSDEFYLRRLQIFHYRVTDES